jgi:hypothetical protein
MALAAVFFLLIVLQGALAAGARIDRPIRMVGTLGVNASNADRSVADGKCEREGVREIRSLLEQSGIEELWAFLPRAGPAGSCQWHEIGRNEQSGVDEALVDVDWEYLEALMTGNDAVHLYHFHPRVFFDYANSSSASGPEDSFQRALVTDLRFSMPSPADIHFMMEITSRFHLRHPRGGDIRNRVVTPYGLVDYALTEAGRARYESDKDARTQGLYIKYVAASALDDTSIEAIVAGYPNDIAAAMQRLVASLNTKYLRIEFSPFSND